MGCGRSRGLPSSECCGGRFSNDIAGDDEKSRYQYPIYQRAVGLSRNEGGPNGEGEMHVTIAPVMEKKVERNQFNVRPF